MSGSLLLLTGAGAIGVGILLLTVSLFSSRSQQRGVSGAVASIERNYARQAQGPVARLDEGRTTQAPAWARRLAVRLSPAGVAASLQRRLDLAGNSPSWTADRILALKGIGLLAGTLFGALVGGGFFSFLLSGTGNGSASQAIVVAAVGGGCGFFLPDVLLYNAGIKRQALIVSALPDALDMLTVCVEAGLGFDGALAQVARNTGGPLAEEFARALQEMQIGRSRTQSLRGMVDRTTVPELRSFVSALVQASELGIPVGRVLREQAGEMRIRRRQRAEEKAQKVPVKIMFPLIICLFPALLVIVLGPGVVSIAHALFGYGG
ncbi:MAG TPA: type II secretion system F family protein [Streptosporangiaceae bacterium]|nr:type II secretion system F family protein [Streptosporangiaceae bacterium]